jgi:hypothetical protein
VSLSITTIGYGDFVPTKKNTIVFTIFYVLFGVVRIMTLLTQLAEGAYGSYEHVYNQL